LSNVHVPEHGDQVPEHGVQVPERGVLVPDHGVQVVNPVARLGPAAGQLGAGLVRHEVGPEQAEPHREYRS
jgi:hypothetical protein